MFLLLYRLLEEKVLNCGKSCFHPWFPYLARVLCKYAFSCPILTFFACSCCVIVVYFSPEVGVVLLGYALFWSINWMVASFFLYNLVLGWVGCNDAEVAPWRYYSSQWRFRRYNDLVVCICPLKCLLRRLNNLNCRNSVEFRILPCKNLKSWSHWVDWNFLFTSLKFSLTFVLLPFFLFFPLILFCIPLSFHLLINWHWSWSCKVFFNFLLYLCFCLHILYCHWMYCQVTGVGFCCGALLNPCLTFCLYFIM